MSDRNKQVLLASLSSYWTYVRTENTKLVGTHRSITTGNPKGINRGKLITKWTILVCLNAVLSFTLALSESRSSSEIIAMIAGIVTFIGFYVALERWALKKGWNAFVFRLSIATVIKAFTQFAPILEIWAGIGALIAVGAIFPEKGFFQAYFATLVDGFLLSLAVGVLVGLMFLVERLYRAYRTNTKAA